MRPNRTTVEEQDKPKPPSQSPLVVDVAWLADGEEGESAAQVDEKAGREEEREDVELEEKRVKLDLPGQAERPSVV